MDLSTSTRLIKELDLVNKRLENKRFVSNTKAEVIQKEKDKLADYQEKLDNTQKLES